MFASSSFRFTHFASSFHLILHFSRLSANVLLLVKFCEIGEKFNAIANFLPVKLLFVFRGSIFKSFKKTYFCLNSIWILLFNTLTRSKWPFKINTRFTFSSQQKYAKYIVFLDNISILFERNVWWIVTSKLNTLMSRSTCWLNKYIYQLFLYGVDTRTCLRALATGLIPIMSKWANCLMRWMPIGNGDPRRHHSPLAAVAGVLTIQPWPIRSNGLAPAEQYHTSAKTASRFWKGTFLHGVVYNWRWCICITLIKIWFLFKQINLKMSSAKCRLFCLRLNRLMQLEITMERREQWFVSWNKSLDVYI